MPDRYYIAHLSLGSAGLAARPSVMQRDGWGPGRNRRVRSFRTTEEAAAQRLADKLNRDDADVARYFD